MTSDRFRFRGGRLVLMNFLRYSSSTFYLTVFPNSSFSSKTGTPIDSSVSRIR
jgi:hypothetical protein